MRYNKTCVQIVLMLFVMALPPIVKGDAIRGAAVATASPLATAAGVNILASGGNAFDAAVAVSAVLAVVEPYHSGFGGGGFWLLYDATDKKSVVVDGREVAPGKAHQNMYLNKKGEVSPRASLDGALAAAIPGEMAALGYIASQYGNLPLRQTLAPAIDYAKNGFIVTKTYRQFAKMRFGILKKNKACAKIFLSDGAVPRLGYRLKQIDLANTLEKIVENGPDAFYKGDIAKELVSGINEVGGIWTAKDLADYTIKIRSPVQGTYHGYTITTVGPPSAGGIIIINILNMLERYRIVAMSKVKKVHLLAEAMRRAFYDRARYLGDSDFVKVPVKKLLTKTYANTQRRSINLDKATENDKLGALLQADERQSQTTHFSIIDKDGNRVAATLSINTPFGSGVVAGTSGILLNNEMDDFNQKPNVPNTYGLVGQKANLIEPGKRPLSSMSPTFIESSNKIAILGTPGGSRIPTMNLLAILELIDGNYPNKWVSKARFHHQYLPNVIEYEKGTFSDSHIKALKAMGHDLRELKWYFGNMHAILVDKSTNQIWAASDPRGEGQSIVIYRDYSVFITLKYAYNHLKDWILERLKIPRFSIAQITPNFFS